MIIVPRRNKGKGNVAAILRGAGLFSAGQGAPFDTSVAPPGTPAAPDDTTSANEFLIFFI